MHTHPHTYPSSASASLSLRRGRQRPQTRSRKHEERIARRVHLDSAKRQPGNAAHLMVLHEKLPVLLGAKLLEQPRRSSMSVEQERHRPHGEVLPHTGSFPPATGGVQGRLDARHAAGATREVVRVEHADATALERDRAVRGFLLQHAIQRGPRSARVLGELLLRQRNRRLVVGVVRPGELEQRPATRTSASQ